MDGLKTFGMNSNPKQLVGLRQSQDNIGGHIHISRQLVFEHRHYILAVAFIYNLCKQRRYLV